MYRSKRLIALFILFLGLKEASAIDVLGKPCFVTPGFAFGYTFHAGMHWGFTLDAGLSQKKENNPVRYGISGSWYFVSLGNGDWHRMRSINLMAANNFADIKMGFGRARNKWGKSNRCITHGFNMDISFAFPNKLSPWIGYRSFRYPPSSWAWFMYPYRSVYLAYKYDLIGNTKLNEMSF